MPRFSLARGTQRETLKLEEFTSLREVAKGSMQRAIPDAHRQRLIDNGYVKNIACDEATPLLALTGAGMRRLISGNWWLAIHR